MISIVGAGPGDPELLTIKAYNRIQHADVILHDHLISQSILDLIPENALQIEVGRKYGDKTSQQERQRRINQLMVEHSREDKNVVRIKSGDPFVYSRAMEEIRYLMDEGMAFECIPGITAGTAAANIFHVPLTERTRTNSVLFCTGHTANYDYEHLHDLAKMLKEGTSLVMYMGLKSLHEVVPKLKEICGDMEIWVNLFSKVSQEGQKVITARLEDIQEEVKKQNPELPVIFIIGQYAVPLN